MLQRFVWALFAAVLSGCVSTPTSKFGFISPSTRSALGGAEPVFVEVLPGKGFSHGTSADSAVMATGMMFGAIGGAIGAGVAIKNANRRGAELTSADGLIDPAKAVADKLRQRLVAAGHPYSDQANLRFQVTTTGWGLNKGTLVYGAALQIGEKFGKFTKGECKYFRKPAELGADSDALLADSGARLKLEYMNAADYCASYFSGVLMDGKQ